MALCVVRLDTEDLEVTSTIFINVGLKFTFFEREREREIHATARRTENIIQ